MTELVRVVRTIRGRPEPVMNALETARDQGRLVEILGGRQLADGDFVVSVALMEPATRVRRRPIMSPWYRRRPRLAATMVALIVTMVAFLVYLVYQLTVLIMTHLAEVLVSLSIIAVLLGTAGHKLTKAAGCCPCHRR